MYLQRQTTRGVTYLLLKRSECNSKTGVRRNVTVQSFGNIAKIPPEELKRIEELYGDPNKRRQANREMERNQFAKMLEKTAELKKDFDLPIFNYGMFLLKPVWEKDMDMKMAFRYLQKDTKIEYDINKVASYIAMSKIIAPGSLKATYEKRCSFLGAPLGEHMPEDMYKCLQFVGENRDYLLSHINRVLDKEGRRDLSLVFYDCTNFYYETTMDDEEKRERARSALLRVFLPGNIEGCTEDNVDLFIGTEAAAPWEEKIEDMLYEVIRMRGPSKEKRTDLPLVSIALVIDKNGIPVDFQIYPGNSSEKTTMVKSIQQMKDKLKIKKCMVIADAGLNSTQNLQMLEREGLGYSVAQSALTLSNTDAKALLDKSKYEEITDEEGNGTGIFSYIAPYTRTTSVKNAQGVYVKQTVNCKILCTWSKKRENRDLELIAKKECRANKAVANKEIIAASKNGWQTVCQSEVDAKKLKALSINQKLLDKWKERAGFACQLFKEVPGEKTPLTAQEVKEYYHRHVRIEDCFRIMKNDFALRPAYVWTPASIRGHITLCVLALIMLRLMELKLKDKQTPMSTNRIISELQNSNVVGLKMDNRWMYQRCSAMKLKFSGFKNNRIEVDEPRRNDIFAAVGLTPLPTIADRSTISDCFKISTLDVDPIVDAHYDEAFT